MTSSSIRILFCALFLFSVTSIPLSAAEQKADTGPRPVPAAPRISAKAHLLMDALTGSVISEENADQRMAPASLTKMMTGYVLSQQVAAGQVHWEDMVHISPAAWAQNPLFSGSSLMWVEVNTKVSLKDLYYGLVISSGNDASVAIAEHVAGSEDSFADMMNRESARLGMQNTHWVNSHGLPDPEHYTTARDLAILARAMIRDHPADYAVYAERNFRFNNIRQGNRNELLGEPGVDGIKTGHTQEAGYCLVSSAKRRGMRLIAVVMGTASRVSRTEESRKLLTYGFRFFETRKLFTGGESLQESRVWSGAADSVRLGLSHDVFVTIPRGRFEDLAATTTVDTVIRAPFDAGKELGKVSVALDGEKLVDEPLAALDAVESGSFLARMWDALVLFFLRLFGRL